MALAAEEHGGIAAALGIHDVHLLDDTIVVHQRVALTAMYVHTWWVSMAVIS